MVLYHFVPNQKMKSSGFFHFEANDYLSDNYRITVFGKATIGRLQAKLIYPAYLKRQKKNMFLFFAKHL